jgi:hypothetical protein
MADERLALFQRLEAAGVLRVADFFDAGTSTVLIDI